MLHWDSTVFCDFFVRLRKFPMCFLRRLGKKSEKWSIRVFLARRRRKQIGNFAFTATLPYFAKKRSFVRLRKFPICFLRRLGKKSEKWSIRVYSCSTSKKTNRELCFDSHSEISHSCLLFLFRSVDYSTLYAAP